MLLVILLMRDLEAIPCALEPFFSKGRIPWPAMGNMTPEGLMDKELSAPHSRLNQPVLRSPWKGLREEPLLHHLLYKPAIRKYSLNVGAFYLLSFLINLESIQSPQNVCAVWELTKRKYTLSLQ